MIDPTNINAYRDYAHNNARSLSHFEEIVLAERIRDNDADALQELVDAHLLFALDQAEAYQAVHGSDLSALIEAANNGLYRAARAYSNGDGVKYRFKAYAAWWLRKYMSDSAGDVGKF